MELTAFFRDNTRAALAFSGGVDSAYLLYAAIECGAAVRAYYVKSPFQPQFELEDALRMAEYLHADMKVLEADVLSDPVVAANPADRCYFCKKHIFCLKNFLYLLLPHISPLYEFFYFISFNSILFIFFTSIN